MAVRVFPWNTADPTAFTEIVTAMKDTFALQDLVLVGDRGMITTARIAALRELNEDGTGFGWITALRGPAVAKLAADQGPLQMSLFDTHDLAEIAHPDYPGERLIACRNPALAVERARKRDELLAATEKLLGPIIARVAAGRFNRCRRDRRRRRAGDRQVQGGQALSPHHHRHRPHRETPTRPDRRRGRPGRHLRAAHLGARRHPRRRRGGGRARTSPTSNATSASSRSTTWTCGPSTTASTTASKPTC